MDALLQKSTDNLELSIVASSVGLYQPSGPGTSNTSPALDPKTKSTGFIRLLSGPLADFTRYSREEHAKWVMGITHGICDPRTMRDSLSVWDDAQQHWSPVVPTDPLTASSYRYNMLPALSAG
ncbi:hypothetical protein DFH09DRAFT_1371567 [Mycena vulgaris]|nr:hypothetical protein DFH09DRAFT_1371567 [Mycena vulgaris]